jgi:cysteine desulfurase
MALKPVYLDYQATTPVDKRVLDVMLPYFSEHFANPASSTHIYGEKAAKELDCARDLFASFINAKKNEIVFTSGATESNNFALKGLEKLLQRKNKTHIISSQIEHKAVIEPLKYLQERGFELTLLKPNLDGALDLDLLQASLKPNTGLISIMHANNEIGTINPIKQIGKIAKEAGALFHCDAAQTLGKLEIDVEEFNIDLLATSAHKIYGPKGIGSLYIRKGLKLESLLLGGSQENDFRAGSPALPLIIGFVEAVRIAYEDMEQENHHLKTLSDFFLSQLTNIYPRLELNGCSKNRLPNNLNISFIGIESETLMMNLWNDLAVSNGSACSSLNWSYSHVLQAMGLSIDHLKSAVRFSFGRLTNKSDLEIALNLLDKTFKLLI